MKHEQFQPFIGCCRSYQDADIVLFGAPYDGTASFRKGTRFAPEKMRAVSEDAIETYSPYQDKDLSDMRICDIGDIALDIHSPVSAVDAISQKTRGIIEDGKRPVMIGGEHLVSLGAVRALADKHPDLHVVHLDAHADLRDDYLGEKHSHATVMRRIWDIVGDARIFQYGIRSGEKAELMWGKSHVCTQMFDCSNIDCALEKTDGKPVYLSIDLDVLDSSVLPGTGTPEAGGIMFGELVQTIIKLSKARIVGADLCELSPPCDPSGTSTAVACKALRELLLALPG